MFFYTDLTEFLKKNLRSVKMLSRSNSTGCYLSTLLLITASLIHGSKAGAWVGTGTGVLLATSTANSYDISGPNTGYGYGLMSTPRMTGTNEFVFFSSSDTHVTAPATATTPPSNLKIHLMRFQNNILTPRVAESPVSNNSAGNGFNYIESEGNGYIACSLTTAAAERRCHGDRFTSSLFSTSLTYHAIGLSPNPTLRYKKLRGNGGFKRFVFNDDNKIQAFQPE